MDRGGPSDAAPPRVQGPTGADVNKVLNLIQEPVFLAQSLLFITRQSSSRVIFFLLRGENTLFRSGPNANAAVWLQDFNQISLKPGETSAAETRPERSGGVENLT